MDVQQVVKDVAPWVAVIGSVGALVGGIGRYQAAPRLRANMAKDLELLEKAPAAAKEALEEALEHQAGKLRDRVIHGWRPRSSTSLIILSGLITAFGGLYAYLGTSSEVFLVGALPWAVALFFRVFGLVLIVVGSASLLFVSATVFMEWIAPESRSPRELVYSLIVLLARIRARQRARSASKPQDASA